jgi:uncharacterized UPF0160 family protein
MNNAHITIVTHSGNFHVDELFAVATLQLLHADSETTVIRSRDPLDWAKGDYVVDVGGEYNPSTKRYDHHQLGGGGARANGFPYSSFGLVWKHHGLELCGSEDVALRIDRDVVLPIDLVDNGIDVYKPVHEGCYPYLMYRIIMLARPTWKEGAVQTERFMELLPWAREVLKREIVVARDTFEGEEFVRRAYEDAADKRLIVLEKSYPWHGVLGKTPDALYVVKPKTQGGQWEVECVRDDTHSFANRKSLPPSWRGCRDQELVQVTGVSDAVFCHNGGFIAVAESREGALRLAELALLA